MMNIYEETDLKLESEKQLKNCEDMHIWVKPIKDYIKELEAKEERAKKVGELLWLYQKKEQCIVCAPLMKDSPILHCVVRYSDDEKYMRVLSQIKQLEEELT